jgi:hypothetical protein
LSAPVGSALRRQGNFRRAGEAHAGGAPKVTFFAYYLPPPDVSDRTHAPAFFFERGESTMASSSTSASHQAVSADSDSQKIAAESLTDMNVFVEDLLEQMVRRRETQITCVVCTPHVR